MEIIGVSGNIKALTSDINWVYNLTNTGKESPKSITDKLVSQYMSDFRKKVSKKLRLTNVEPAEKANYCAILGVEDLEFDNTDLDIEKGKSDVESSELEIQKSKTISYDSSLDSRSELLDEQKINLEKEKLNLEGQNFFMALSQKSSNTVEHGIYLEDIPSIERVETPSGIKPVDDREYIEHGVYLDELQVAKVEDDGSCEEHEVYLEDEIIPESVDDKGYEEDSGSYVEHGVYLEDVIIENEQVGINIKEDSEVICNDEDDEIGEDDETISDVEDSVNSEIKITNTEPTKVHKPNTDSIQKGKTAIESPTSHKKPVKKPVTPKLPTAKAVKIEDHSDSATSAPITKVPSNVRDFVKSCKGKRCPVSEALKYYTKEQLQKALKVGKIQEHKGMLSV